MKQWYVVLFVSLFFPIYAMDIQQITNEDLPWIPSEEEVSRSASFSSQHTPETALLDEKGRLLSMVRLMTALDFKAEKDGLDIVMLEKSFEKIPAEIINILIEKYPDIFSSFIEETTYIQQQKVRKVSDSQKQKVRELLFQEGISAGNKREEKLSTEIVNKEIEVDQLLRSQKLYKNLSCYGSCAAVVALLWATVATYFAMAP